MENKRFYMKREVFLSVVCGLLFINEIYIVIKIVQDGFSQSYLFDILGWSLIFFVSLYSLITILRKKVYIDFLEDKIVYKGILNVEKTASYDFKYEYKKTIKNQIKKVTFYGKKEMIELVINRYSFPNMNEIVDEIERRMKK